MSPYQSHTHKVSVVMSLYKEPMRWIREAVESILAQTFRDFEFIIICDNPDYTEAISYIQGLMAGDPRIRLICNPTNIGLTKSLNIGIETSCGEYIARMDADDIALPERLERQVAFLEAHPEISICASNAHVIDAEGKIARRDRYIRKTDPCELIISNILAHPSVTMRRSLLQYRCPLYNEDYPYSQDYELWQYMLRKGVRPYVLKEPLLLYRKSEVQISAKKKTQQVECFKNAHRTLITGWLLDRGIIREDDCNDMKKMLSCACEAYSHIDLKDKADLAHIIYVLYFSLATYDWKYAFRYLADRNMIAFRIRFIFTFRLFVSRKTRRNRTGFN